MGGIAFDALTEPPRLRVADTVGNEQYELHLESPVSPEPISTDGFAYPVSDAVQFTASGFDLLGIVQIHLWDDEELVEVLNSEENSHYVPAGEHTLELCRTLKTYLEVPGELHIESDPDGARVRFDGPTTITVGVRSPRKQPSDTVTTTSEPTDVMDALSFLGEGLMTTSPMRAYPSLRGYPPDVRLGDELRIPETLDPGPQPISVILPPDLEYIYEATPLTYYLNASLEPGSRPAITVRGEPIYEFSAGSFNDEVKEVLDHVFVLDCVVRTAGPYPLESAEYDLLEDTLPDDIEEIYHADQGERLRAYLDVPLEPVARQQSPNPTTGYVEPTPESVDAIPHLVAQLTPVVATTGKRISGHRARREALAAFTESGQATRAASEVFDGDASFVDVGDAEASGDLWIGDDVPFRVNKLLVEGFRNRFDRSASDRTSIDVTIVCNERWMNGETETVETYYGEREDLPFEVTVQENLDREAMRAVLQTETDFLHYVGHATADGLKCRDGYLDVSTLETIGIETFLLNACQSYQQAVALVETGSIGGIATLSDVTDDQAAGVGRTVARLLNLGFPLRRALEIGRSRSVIGGQYLAIGDDSVTLVPSDGFPQQLLLESRDSGYDLTIQSYPTPIRGPGAVFTPLIGQGNEQYLMGKSFGPVECSARDLKKVLERTNVPVDYDGEFRWAYDLAEDLA